MLEGSFQVHNISLIKFEVQGGQDDPIGPKN